MPVYRQMAQAHNITITQEQADWSFISSVLAYPVKLTVGQGLSSPSRVDVETVSVLPPLPAGWEDSLEDLKYQATPTSEYAPNYVAKIITTIDSAIGVKQPAPKLNNNAGTTAYAHMQTAPATPEAPNTASNVSTTPINASANVNPFSNEQKPVQSPAPNEPVQQDNPFAIPAIKPEQEEDATADSFASSKVDTPMAGKAADAVKDDDQPKQTLPDTQASNGVQTPDDISNTGIATVKKPQPDDIMSDNDRSTLHRKTLTQSQVVDELCNNKKIAKVEKIKRLKKVVHDLYPNGDNDSSKIEKIIDKFSPLGDDDQPEQALPDAQASDAQASNEVQTPDDILNAMPDYLKDGLEGIK